MIHIDRSQVSLKIDSSLLGKYEELRREKRTQVVYGVENPSCPACGMGLPAGFVSAVSAHDGAEICSNCGVFLFWTGYRD